MKATLTFPSRSIAQTFATLWSRHSFKGYTLSATRSDGSATVDIYGITETDKPWIEATVLRLNSVIST